MVHEELRSLVGTDVRIAIEEASRIQGKPELPSSKYFTLRYVLAAALAKGTSMVYYPAQSDDSEALFRGCRALGAQLDWVDAEETILRVQGVGYPQAADAVTLNVGNAGAVLRLLLGLGACLPEITFVTDHPQSLGKRPNRELLEALSTLGATYQAEGAEGCLPITLRRSALHGGKVRISGARSSQYISALLFLAPLLPEGLEIEIIDGLKSQPFVRSTLQVLHEAGIQFEHSADLSHLSVPGKQQYQAREYILPGDYPSAAALISACISATDPASELVLNRLKPGDEIGNALLAAYQAMGAQLDIAGEQVTVRGGATLQGVRVDGDRIIDCIPVLVAAACFAQGESVFYNIETLHYKESDRIDDLCAELRRAGCDVTPQRDAIIVRGRPQGIEGGVTVDGHNDHRLLMALAIVGMRCRQGLALTGSEHIAKSYPHFFAQLKELGVPVKLA
ncbi:3-phosphoshikimate 1-carboxyvinyltransferase [Ktedonobacter sp. SOSP1-52]|uniref:3-phosphoshikimate 1-carboxyvinyltransferase n=1 Tax=Ktedonobacter sp. SOSP1-52 TaxID=2778366 RepID=UPI001915543B|nr:3-phosphoshikimate 1-carboxyvinyltransferase [Ktedonobacter sp. SOSP1-52]GHO67003.1 3-phosphoshikimate 1-carboxyvinyltransferase [Ktedonobacter sp. SOSP1-52]